jgi:hypothetical protein
MCSLILKNMYTTYHLSSTQEVNEDILEAIKVAYKSRPIAITIAEDWIY